MSRSPRVTIIRDPADSLAAQRPVSWALEQLRDALSHRGLVVEEARQLSDVTLAAPCLVVASRDSLSARAVLTAVGVSVPDDAESLALVPGRVGGRSVVLVTGADVRGFVYAVLEVADRVAYLTDPLSALRVERPVVERPANPIRGVTRLFASDVEDKSWFYDRAFWRDYLSMLASQRFNRFSLALGMGHDFLRNVIDATFLFPYPFLVSVPGHAVRVAGLPDDERERNLATLRFIAEETKARGLRFQLGLWTHGYQWVDSPNANYVVEGLTAENHAAYCRDALRTLLVACPSIDGVTFRVHGESGVPEGNYDFWRVVFDGVVQCGRPVEIDVHPKGLDRRTIDLALATGLPVTISPKYTAEHMGLPYQQSSIRELERVPRLPEGDSFVSHLMSRSGGDLRYTRYGYADFLEEDRRYGVFFRLWPGTQRLLLWGDPALAAGFGRHAHFAGCLGLELCEPLSFKGRRGSGLPGGRDAYADPSLRPSGGDWQKYLYTYHLFGRLLYNPDADPESWRRCLRHEFGEAAAPVEAALSRASRILPLVTTAFHPSAANNRYWPEIYTNLPIADAGRPHPYGDTPSPKRFGTVSPLDPALFAGVDDFADELVGGRRSGKYSPLRVARWLENLAEIASQNLADAERRVADRADPAFRRLAIDVRVQCGLGRFFAQQLRAGVAYALYARTADLDRLREAVEAYRAARSAWVGVVEQTVGVYRDDVTVGGEPWLRGHWADRLAAIDADLNDLEDEWKRVLARSDRIVAPAQLPLALRRPLGELDDEPPAVACQHEPPKAFRRGTALPIDLTLPDDGAETQTLDVFLHYRHVNQAEVYQVVAMERQDGRFRTSIPADYADSPFPLQYFFELRDARGHAWFYPGLSENLANQPYFLVRQKRGD